MGVIPIGPMFHAMAFTAMANAGISPPSAFTRHRQDVGRFYEAALPRRAVEAHAASSTSPPPRHWLVRLLASLRGERLKETPRAHAVTSKPRSRPDGGPTQGQRIARLEGADPALPEPPGLPRLPVLGGPQRQSDPPVLMSKANELLRA